MYVWFNMLTFISPEGSCVLQHFGLVKWVFVESCQSLSNTSWRYFYSSTYSQEKVLDDVYMIGCQHYGFRFPCINLCKGLLGIIFHLLSV